jgi:predicted DNA-binding antitoxin AbrB/MazE fold protein
MTAIRAVYDGNVFIPEKPCEIISGSEVTLTIETINTCIHEKQKKLAALRQLTKELNVLNETDPLPPEFDEILSQRVQLRELNNL